MKLTTIIELRKDDVAGKSILLSDVSEGYGEEQLAARMIRQYQAARSDLIVNRTAKRAVLTRQRELFAEFSGA